MRENAGFEIIKAETYKTNLDGKTKEIVLGEATFTSGRKQWVTWECTGGNNYFWGHYYFDYTTAVIDYHKRLVGCYEEAPF